MIAYSSCMFVVTSIRMGRRYPFKGTMYLLLSSQPPVYAPRFRLRLGRKAADLRLSGKDDNIEFSGMNPSPAKPHQRLSL